jgi:hypothetical protein
MKRQALNRKNSLFVGNPRGGETAAILSSLTSSCRRHGIDPQCYLTQLLVNLPGVPEAKLDGWLPDVWKVREAERERVDGVGRADTLRLALKRNALRQKASKSRRIAVQRPQGVGIARETPAEWR